MDIGRLQSIVNMLKTTEVDTLKWYIKSALIKEVHKVLYTNIQVIITSRYIKICQNKMLNTVVFSTNFVTLVSVTFFFLGHTHSMKKFPGPENKPAPQQGQCQSLNLISYQELPCFDFQYINKKYCTKQQLQANIIYENM